MSTHGSTSNPYTSGIADFVTGLRYEDIPADVVARIKLLMLDSLGCALYGADLPWSRILMETLAETDTSTGVSVWGTDRRLSAPHAALVNGTLVQSFELDDVHRVGVLHVGAVTLPALFAVAEMRPGMSGRELLKFYSCVGSNHTTLDAIRKMQALRTFTEPDVAGIMVHWSQVTMGHVGWRYEPQGLTSAQLNLPYCVAT